jgi:hypothetical protein
MLTLDVPAGALTAETTISVEPLTNTAPGGIGLGYRLLPERLTFSSPATLTIGYTAEGIAPSSLAIAYQDTARIWQGIVSESSATQKAVTARISHFTAFLLHREWSVIPDDAPAIPVGQSQQYTAVTTHVLRSGSVQVSEEPLHAPPLLLEPADVGGWSVNGIPGGNAEYGRIVPGSNPATATYTAPSTVPQKNPVIIGVTINGLPAGKNTVSVSAQIVDVESRWRVDWDKITRWVCPSGVGRTDLIHYTFEMHGTDTLVLGMANGQMSVTPATGMLTFVNASELGECPGSKYSGLTMDRPPSITNPTTGAVELYLLPPLAPTQMVYRSGGGTISPGNATDYPVGSSGPARKNDLSDGSAAFSFSLWYRFPLPFQDGAVHDTTFLTGASTLEVQQHATLSRIR